MTKIIIIVEDSKTKRSLELIDTVLRVHYIWSEIRIEDDTQ